MSKVSVKLQIEDAENILHVYERTDNEAHVIAAADFREIKRHLRQAKEYLEEVEEGNFERNEF